MPDGQIEDRLRWVAVLADQEVMNRGSVRGLIGRVLLRPGACCGAHRLRRQVCGLGVRQRILAPAVAQLMQHSNAKRLDRIAAAVVA